MRILVLGAYGFIGLEASRRLIAAGHAVLALGRSVNHGRRVLPDAIWKGADIAKFGFAGQWTPLLRNVDVVVNASGALQDGLRDDLRAVQDKAIRALITACEGAGVNRFVQISAPDARPESGTAFYRTKASADSALKASTLSWTLLRPGLVWGRTASGGTALVRMLSAFPVLQPLVLPESRVQMVDIEAVCDAVAMAVTSDDLNGRDIDLVDTAPHTLAEVTLVVRQWHGFATPWATLRIPFVVGSALAFASDIGGWLGWRSPLRTTSLLSLKKGVVGDASAWSALSGTNESFAVALRTRPATRQDRAFARTQLLLPIIVLGLSTFWIASGLIGIAQSDQAITVIGDALDHGEVFVIAGAFVDIALGVALLWRPWARIAALGMIAVTAAYLVAGSIFTPELWADPLGPLVKPIPAALLALVCATLLEER
jgi:uncharacterized protein YbjT (DUF2867 family)